MSAIVKRSISDREIRELAIRIEPMCILREGEDQDWLVQQMWRKLGGLPYDREIDDVFAQVILAAQAIRRIFD